MNPREADPEVEDVELHDEEGIPVLYAKWVASQDFANSALEMQEEANMVNLTGNGRRLYADCVGVVGKLCR